MATLDRPALRSAVAWAEARLRALGHAPCAPAETVRAMPWSTAIRLPTPGGAFYLKLCAPVFAAEAAVLAHLRGTLGGAVTEVVAAAPERGWFVMPDAGVPLRSVLARDFDAEPLARALEACADLQIAAADAPTLLGLGLPDWRLANFPALFEAFLDGGALQGLDGAGAAEVAAYRRLVPKAAGLCAELAAHGLPETLEHGDFHDNNILVRDGRITLADFGDAVFAHPFFSLATCLHSVARHHGAACTDADLARLRTRYLERWTAIAPRPALEAALTLAERLGPLRFALGFARLWGNIEPAELRPYRGYLTEALDRFARL